MAKDQLLIKDYDSVRNIAFRGTPFQKMIQMLLSMD